MFLSVSSRYSAYLLAIFFILHLINYSILPFFRFWRSQFLFSYCGILYLFFCFFGFQRISPASSGFQGIFYYHAPVSTSVAFPYLWHQGALAWQPERPPFSKLDAMKEVMVPHPVPLSLSYPPHRKPVSRRKTGRLGPETSGKSDPLPKVPDPWFCLSGPKPGRPRHKGPSLR